MSAKGKQSGFFLPVSLLWAESAHRPHKLAVILGVLKVLRVDGMATGNAVSQFLSSFLDEWHFSGSSLSHVLTVAQSRLIRKALPHLQGMCKTPSGFQLQPRDLCLKFSFHLCLCRLQPAQELWRLENSISYSFDCEFIVHQTVKWFFKIIFNTVCVLTKKPQTRAKCMCYSH